MSGEQPPGAAVTTLVELTRSLAARQPERVAFTYEPEGGDDPAELTYGELDRRARHIAGAIRSAGPAERAILLYEPGLEYIAAFFGCLYAGTAAVPAYVPLPGRTATHLAAVVGDARPSLVLSTPMIQAYLQHVAETVPELAGLDWLLTDGLAGPGEGPGPEPSAIHGDTVALLQYTSGSTASPRGVIISHANLLANLRALHRNLVPPGENRGVSWLPPYHDMGLVGAILLTLYDGARTTLLSPIQFLQRPLSWLEAMSRTGSTISGAPNFAYELCVRRVTPDQRAGLDLSRWRVAAVGAEPVRAATLAAFSAAFAGCGFRPEAFHPCYGMAETALLVSCKRPGTAPTVRAFDAGALASDRVAPLADADRPAGTARTLVSCGPPAASGNHAEIVTPGTGDCCPPDEVGEVWLRGPSVGRGYFDRSESTAETFEARLADGTGPFLRTGDLGFLHDGELYVTGRRKDLVIVRGLNHHAQDLELTAQLAHPLLRPGGGAAFTVDGGEEERVVLVHELRSRDPLPEEDLEDAARAVRRALAEEHAVQVHTVALVAPGTVPKTPSGKTRRRACRDAYLDGSLDAVAVIALDRDPASAPRPGDAPRTPGEELLAGIWSEVLGVDAEHVGVESSFFDLGGDSLAAVHVAARVRDVFGAELPPEGLFEAPTVAALARRLEAGATPRLPPVEPASRRTPAGEFPLSHAQSRLWAFQRETPGDTGPGDDIPVAVRLSGPLDEAALVRSFEEVIRRHDVLRTTFVTRGGTPLQVVDRHDPPVVARVDLSAVPGPDRDAELLALLRTEQRRVFDLRTGPLLRVTVVRCAETEWALLLNVHHLVFDGWSTGVLVRELGALYEAFSAGRPSPLPDPAIQYADYAAWQRRWLDDDALAAHLAWWEAELAGAPAVLELPADRPRPAVRSSDGARYRFDVPEPVARRLVALGRAEGATLFMTLLAALKALLHLRSGQTDVVVGAYAANRQPPATAALIGLFANPVAVRTRLDARLGFRELLRRVRRAALAASAHQDAPFQRVVERLGLAARRDVTPVYQVMLVMQDLSPYRAAGLAAVSARPLREDWVEWDAELAPCDLELHLAQGPDGGLLGDLCYSTDLFERLTAAGLVSHFQRILEAVAADPDQRLERLRG